MEGKGSVDGIEYDLVQVDCHLIQKNAADLSGLVLSHGVLTVQNSQDVHDSNTAILLSSKTTTARQKGLIV